MRDVMNEKSAVDQRPYKCPGCDINLPAGTTAVLEHMNHCTQLQDMIVVGRAGARLRCKNKKTLRVIDTLQTPDTQ